MVFIDTHIAVWLYSGSVERLSKKGTAALESNDIFISPVAVLEMEYLHEIGKIKKNSGEIVSGLENEIGLRIHDISLSELITSSIGEKWTRDPFDRMIVAHARGKDVPLVTADGKIRRHYRKALL